MATRPSNIIPAVFKTPDAAAYVGLAETTLEKMRVTGTGPDYVKLGRAVRYRACDLDAWVNARVMSSTSSEATAAPEYEKRDCKQGARIEDAPSDRTPEFPKDGQSSDFYAYYKSKGIGSRAASCLINYAYGQDWQNEMPIRSMTDWELLRIPNLGRKSLKEVRKAFPFVHPRISGYSPTPSTASYHLHGDSPP